jgi:hypothetical protein
MQLLAVLVFPALYLLPSKVINDNQNGVLIS